jgi:hypothetical protein
MSPQDARNHPPAPDEPLDDTDLTILDAIREMFEAADPMPADLPERVRFSLTLRGLEVEVARLTAEDDQPALAARGEEQSRTITFDSDSLTIMIRIDSNRDGTVRVDGWLAPPQSRTVEMRTPAGTLTAPADEQGRFAFSHVPRGTAQLAVRPAGPEAGDAGRSVVTQPLIV